MLVAMSTTTEAMEADRALKERHRAMWAWGDYPRIATELVQPLGGRLVEAAGIRPGHRVLDVAAGSGNASLPAARAGADVVASDLTPELLEAGRRSAEQEGLALTWEQADAENLPYDDASFDVVMSCIGVMFAPHHRDSAEELLRVCRPGGRLALLSWTPAGFIGQMFGVMRPFAAPPPPGAQPPPLWGDEQHVRELFGGRVTDLHATTGMLRVDLFAEPHGFREFFRATYGPTIAVYRNVADDPGRVAVLDEALDDLAAAHLRDDGSMEWEYLVVTATRSD